VQKTYPWLLSAYHLADRVPQNFRQQSSDPNRESEPSQVSPSVRHTWIGRHIAPRRTCRRPILGCFPHTGRERKPTFARSIGPSARDGSGIALAAELGGPRWRPTLRAPGCPHRLPVLSGPGPLRLPHSYCPEPSSGPTPGRTSHNERRPKTAIEECLPAQRPRSDRCRATRRSSGRACGSICSRASVKSVIARSTCSGEAFVLMSNRILARPRCPEFS
jgi:hypothetical protein